MFRFFKEPTFASPSPSYYSSGENFKCMHVLYCGVTWEEAALMEAVLIESHLSKPSNPNVRPRGEGRQVGAGPFFTYVVFKPAMWRTRFGLQKNPWTSLWLLLLHSTIYDIYYGLFSTNDVQLKLFLANFMACPMLFASLCHWGALLSGDWLRKEGLSRFVRDSKWCD